MNGWTNWDTWNVAVALDNVYDTYIQVRLQRFHREDDLKQFVIGLSIEEAACIDEEVDFDEVNWYELLEHLTAGDEEECTDSQDTTMLQHTTSYSLWNDIRSILTQTSKNESTTPTKIDSIC